MTQTIEIHWKKNWKPVSTNILNLQGFIFLCVSIYLCLCVCVNTCLQIREAHMVQKKVTNSPKPRVIGSCVMPTMGANEVWASGRTAHVLNNQVPEFILKLLREKKIMGLDEFTDKFFQLIKEEVKFILNGLCWLSFL